MIKKCRFFVGVFYFFLTKDVKLLPKLKEWKRKAYDENLTPICRLMTAIEEFKDNSK